MASLLPEFNPEVDAPDSEPLAKAAKETKEVGSAPPTLARLAALARPLLSGCALEAGSEPAPPADPSRAIGGESPVRDRADAGRPEWVRNPTITPDSRTIVIPETVRAIIEAIEPQARQLGWPAELLWNSAFWGLPRGLAGLLDEGDDIGAVTENYIEILKLDRHVLRFQRRNS